MRAIVTNYIAPDMSQYVPNFMDLDVPAHNDILCPKSQLYS